jgi:hypothetical protein
MKENWIGSTEFVTEHPSADWKLLNKLQFI